MRSALLFSLSASLSFGCGLAPHQAHSQRISSPATVIQTWRNTAPGSSTTSTLAYYRLRNVGSPDRYRAANTYGPVWRGRTLYNAPYYAITTNRSVPRGIYSSSRYTHNVPVTNSGQFVKPFSGLQRPPNAIERYWPLLMEAREDRRTGLVYWQLP